MLFWCTGPDGVKHQLAFVRCYKDLGPAPAPFGDCQLLQWEEERAPADCPASVFGRRKAAGARRQAARWVIPCYDVFDIQHIDRIVLVQQFGEASAGQFVVNPWIRCKAPSKG
jgi:hypothetical protein